MKTTTNMLLNDWNTGKYSRKQLARKYGITVNGVRNLIKYYRKKYGNVIDKDVRNNILYLPPKFDKFFRINTDKVLITSDWHCPYFDEDLFNKLLDIQKKKKVKDLVIAGDFLDLAGFSKFDDALEHKGQFKTLDLPATKYVLTKLNDVFDNIYILLGNHDKRWIRVLQYEVEHSDIYKLIFNSEKMKISDYSYMIINGCWRITHPKNFSIFFGKVGRDLSEKFKQNICYAHGHQMGLTFDRSGGYFVVASGALVEPQKVDYISLVDTTHPAWQTGFVYLERNIPFLVGKWWHQIDV